MKAQVWNGDGGGIRDPLPTYDDDVQMSYHARLIGRAFSYFAATILLRRGPLPTPSHNGGNSLHSIYTSFLVPCIHRIYFAMLNVFSICVIGRRRWQSVCHGGNKWTGGQYNTTISTPWYVINMIDGCIVYYPRGGGERIERKKTLFIIELKTGYIRVEESFRH